MKNKKALFITLIAVDVAITVFLLVVSIIMLAQTVGKNSSDIQNAKGMIGYFQRHPLTYGLTCVVPLFLILAANIIGLVLYVKKSAKKEKVKVSDLSADEKEALRQELLKDLQNGKE